MNKGRYRHVPTSLSLEEISVDDVSCLSPRGRAVPDAFPNLRRPVEAFANPSVSSEAYRLIVPVDASSTQRGSVEAFTNTRTPLEAFPNTQGPVRTFGNQPVEALCNQRRPTEAFCDHRPQSVGFANQRDQSETCSNYRGQANSLFNPRQASTVFANCRTPVETFPNQQGPGVSFSNQSREALSNRRRPVDAFANSQGPVEAFPDNRQAIGALSHHRGPTLVDTFTKQPVETYSDSRRPVALGSQQRVPLGRFTTQPVETFRDNHSPEEGSPNTSPQALPMASAAEAAAGNPEQDEEGDVVEEQAITPRIKTVLKKKQSMLGMVTAATAASDFLKKRVRTTSRHNRGRGEGYQAPPVPTNRRGRDADIEPVVNGMKCFGIGKSGIARAVVKFSEPPTRHPCTLCFHFPSTFLTHRYVLDMVRTKIHFVPDAKVRSIQYVDRNTIHGTQGLDNRWLITVSNVDGRDELLRLGLHIYNRRITLRRYDDILQDEYREYMQYLELQKKLYVRLQEMAQVQKAVNVQPSSHIQSMAEELRKALGMKDTPGTTKDPAAVAGAANAEAPH